MRQKHFLKSLQLLTLLLFFLQCYAVHGAQDEQFASGSQLPSFTIPAPDSAQAQKYLGLASAEPFTISQIGAKIVMIEFFSALCPHCQTNAPVVNRLYKAIQDDARLAKDVKIIGIAIGNNKKQVDAFKKTYKVPFPLFLDEQYGISGPLGGVDTPTMLVLATGSSKVLACHLGVITDFDGFVKQLREICKKQ
jgi:thiol-disulfide isomerase/thioredoxin